MPMDKSSITVHKKSADKTPFYLRNEVIKYLLTNISKISPRKR